MEPAPVHRDIRPLAGHFGVVPRGMAITLYEGAAVDGVHPFRAISSVGRFPIEISLELDSGATSGLSYTVKSWPLPEIEFRIETRQDQTAKRLTVNREVQTGDVEFDERVFIDSVALDRVVLASLASSDARQAIVELLDASFELSFKASGIHAKKAGTEALEIGQVERTVACLNRISATLPRFEEREIRTGRRFKILSYASVPLFCTICGVGQLALDRMEPLHGSSLAIGGLAVGVSTALLAMVPIFLWLRGTTRSVARIGALFALLIVNLPLAGLAGSMALNGLLDRSPPRRRAVVVQSCRESDDSSTATLAWTHGESAGAETAEVRVKGCKGLPSGKEVELTTRSGAFGAEWVVRLAD